MRLVDYGIYQELCESAGMRPDPPPEHNPTRIGLGGARGAAKSHAGRSVMAIVLGYYPKTRGMVFRQTYDELWDDHISRLLAEFPQLQECYTDKHKTLRLPNGSEMVFVHAPRPEFIRKLKKEFRFMFIDEATELTEEEIVRLKNSNRWPGVGERDCKTWYAMNPGGPGHPYIERVMMKREFKGRERPEDYAFIQAWGWDNAFWATEALRADGLTEEDFHEWSDAVRKKYFIARTQYGRELDSLPPSERDANLLGLWDRFEGQVFGQLDESVHDLDRYVGAGEDSGFRLQDSQAARGFDHSGLKLYSCLDHGSSGITACLQTGMDSDENLLALEEYYEQDKLISVHAKGVLAMLGRYGKQEYTLIDPSTDAATLQGKFEMYSVREAYRREKLICHPAARAHIDVGLDRVNELLRVDPSHRNPFTQELGSPRLFISRSKCENLWREMRGLQRKIVNGVVTFIGSDHALDDLRYIAMSRPKPANRPHCLDAWHGILTPNTCCPSCGVAAGPSLQERHMLRAHDKWAKGFDKKVPGRGGKQWFGRS